MSLLDEFIAATQVPYEDKEIHNVTVRVRGMTAQMQLELADSPNRGAGDITFWVLENCLVDPESGDRLFGDDDPRLRDLSGDILADLANLAMRLSGVEEAAKN
jgi:hypothetical protein